MVKKKRRKREEVRKVRKEGDKSENGRRQSWKRRNESGEDPDGEERRGDSHLLSCGPRPVPLSASLWVCARGPPGSGRVRAFTEGAAGLPLFDLLILELFPSHTTHLII